MLDHGSHWYSTHYNGEWTDVYPLENCVRAILCRNKNNEDRIKRLEEENKRLKDASWKDEELQKMKTKFESMEADYYRGFPISAKEDATIEKWMKKHDEEIHGLTTDTLRMKAGGVSGGRYSYHFLPTSLGVSGVIHCSCGAEFEFQHLG